MGNYQSAGLYTEERSASAGPVASVSTSNYATVGWLPKGPVNQARLVTGFASFVKQFGSHWRNSYVSFAMAAFFQNGGSIAYVNRIVPSDAVEASNNSGLDEVALPAVFYSRQLADPVVTLDATHFNINVSVDAGAAADVDVTGDNGVAGSYALSALAANISGITGVTCTVEATVGGGNRLKVVTDSTGESSALAFASGTANDCLELLFGLTAGQTHTYTGSAAIDWTLQAKWPGAWYNKSAILIEGNVDSELDTGGWSAYDVSMQEESAVGEADWATLETYSGVIFDDETDDQFAPTVINAKTNEITISEGATFETPRSLLAIPRTNECMGSGDGAAVTFSGTLLFPEIEAGTVSIDVDGVEVTDDGEGALVGSNVSAGTINYVTGAFSVTFSVAPTSGVLLIGSYTTSPAATSIRVQLSGGTDGTAVTRNDISEISLQATKSGIYAFDDIDEILNLSLPDFAGDVSVANDMIAYSEARTDVYSILDAPMGLEPLEMKQWTKRTAKYNTKYAGLYYPWISITDPLNTDGRTILVPPGGFAAGVFARTDSNRNVGKAPAGINDGKLLGAVGVERVLSKGDRDVLYPSNINPIVSNPNLGISIWGARNITTDAEWKYIQATRLFMFCEKSIEKASYWVVFENNGPSTWSKMSIQGSSFFNRIFKEKYLAGRTASEAFKIVIDETVNTQDVIDAGEIIADYYYAPNKPGEFVRLRHQQKLQSAA